MRAMLLALVLLMTGLAAAPAVRAQGDLFTVQKVAVDATAANAGQAREAAVAEGQRLAYRRLVERLVPAEDAGRLAPPPEPGLSALVQDFEITAERRSATRWIGELTVRFRPAALRAHLTQAGVLFSELRSRPVVVVPVWQGEQGAVLWDAGNPWRDAWGAASDGDGLVPVVLPLGDLEDLTAVNAERALAGAPEGLAALAARYGAGEALVAVARPAGEGFAASVRRHGGGEAAGFEVSAASLDALVGRTQRLLEESWKSAGIVRDGTPQALPVAIPVASLGEWLSIRQNLSRLPLVKELKVVSVSPALLRVDLTVVGDAAQLDRALAQVQLRLGEEAEPGRSFLIAR